MITNEFLKNIEALFNRRLICEEHLDMFDDDDVDFDDYEVSHDYDNWYSRRCSVDTDIKIMLDQLHPDTFVEIIKEGLSEII